MSSSNSPCAACKFLRRKCTQECVFAPYFPPDQPQKFINVHKVFGASNVAKILNELNASQREDAVNSLAYEAEARLRDPVYGCVGLISVLQHRLKQVQSDLEHAKKELATFIGPQAMLPILPPPAFMMQQQQQHVGNASSSAAVMQHNLVPMMGIPMGSGQLVIRDPSQAQQQHHPQQIFEAQQLAAVREQQEMLRSYEHQQQHHQQQQQPEIVRFNSGCGGFDGQSSSVTATGFNQTMGGLGNFENPYGQIQQQEQQHHNPLHNQTQVLFQSQQNQTQKQSGSEDGTS